MHADARFRTWLDTLSSLAIVAAALALVAATVLRVFVGSPASDRWQGAVAGRVESVEVSVAPDAITKSLGDAGVVLVEFSDFECAFCGIFARDTFPKVKRDLIDTGAIEYVYFHFPLESIHPLAMKASQAAECARLQGRFIDMHKQLFRTGASLLRDQLIASAVELGLDEARFTACLDGERRAEVLSDIETGKRLGVTGTPALFIGTVDKAGGLNLTRKIRGAVPYDVIKAEVNSLLLPRGHVSSMKQLRECTLSTGQCVVAEVGLDHVG